MKKFISFILCLIILISVLPGTVEVHAEEEEQQEEVNEYYLEFLASDFGVSSKYNEGTYNNLQLKFTNKKVVGYYEPTPFSGSCQIYYYVYNSSGILDYNIGAFMVNLVKNCSSWTGTCKSGQYSYASGSVFWFENVQESDNSCGGRTFWNTSSVDESGFIKTNIPLFSDEETARAFINGTVDISQAENYTTDILNKVKDSNEVPMPRNLHIVHEDYRYYIVWEYSSEDLKKISLVSIDGMVYELRSGLKLFGETAYVDTDDLDSCIELDEYLEPRLSYKLDITDDIIRLRNGIEKKLGTRAEYQSIVDYWVIARWDKSEFDMYFSNFAHVKLYISDSDEGFKVDFDTSVSDSEGNVLDDVQFNTGLGSGNAISSNDFIGNIASGFNLLGDNGLIALLTSSLSFIPSRLWMIIGTALSIMVIVALFKLVIK